MRHKFIVAIIYALTLCSCTIGNSSIMMEKRTEYTYHIDGSVTRSDIQTPHKDSQRIAAGVAIAGMGGNGLMMAVGAAADHIGEAISKVITKPSDVLMLSKSSDSVSTVTVYPSHTEYQQQNIQQ